MTSNVVHLVDDDEAVRLSLSRLLRLEGFQVKLYVSAEHFLKLYDVETQGCLLSDVRMPGGMSGIDLLKTLKRLGFGLPVIFMTGYGDISIAVQAMKLGASNFLTKPVRVAELIDAIRDPYTPQSPTATLPKLGKLQVFKARGLSRRECEVMLLVLQGEQNKDIARMLGISPRTVEIHRSNGMRKLNVSSIHGLLQI